MAKYEDAIAKGQHAAIAMHNESALDMLQLNIGNMKPGEKAAVIVKMLKLLEIENEYYLFRLPTSYFTRFEQSKEIPKNEPSYQAHHLTMKKPEYKYKFNVLIEQSSPILNVTTPIQANICQESLSANSANLTFDDTINGAEEAFLHDVMIYFQTTALGKTVVYY